ncbi:SbcC/MukB-like Walker B domain-containing protein [Afipia sp. GAS231]|uniref:SbcC/MukB-like Walker B domain-containing protein n=1 Tax=Afipia sp. GAS231 TaxID=1882747 RepID=UPI00087C2523|nr:SbcC/MukB-like Walker B domain-containing protein [Afipia sp. GAS231]SDO49025.1 Uncharacterized protein YPO0396 [Afipia sp. GAS231]
MIELRRIVLIDWYLFRAEQVDMRGMTALIGPNGAGKSAVIDAVQTVLTGANMTSIRFNPSAQSNTKSKRSIRDYCLGVVSLDEKGERSEPTRSHAYTYVVLGFEDVDSGSTTSIGIAFSASAAKGDESCEARFLVRGPIDTSDLLAPVGGGEVETLQWHAVRNALRSKGIEVEDGYSSASEFVEEMLHALSPAGFPLNARRFVKAFRNALLFKPVDNPTDFVRNYVLDAQPIQIDRLRRSIDHWRYLSGRIENLKAQSASLSQIQRIVARVNENERVVIETEWQIARLRWEIFFRDARRLQEQLETLEKQAATAKVAAEIAAMRLTRIETDFTRVGLTIKTSDGEQLALMYESDRSLAMAERTNALGPAKALERLTAVVETVVDRRLIAGRDDILHGLLSSVVIARKKVPLAHWGEALAEDWQEAAGHLDVALDAVTTERLSAIQKIAGNAYVAAELEVRDIQNRIEQIDSNLSRLDQGLSPIDSGTRALIRQLESVGIEAKPLCDLVEVRDPKWRVAAEAALGRSREALIVEPGCAVRALEAYRTGGEDAYRGAEVVNTTKSSQTRSADKGSLATVITTDNAHARAFLDYRLGRLMMVETMDRMVAAENAITPDRMMQSGRTVKRLARPDYLKLGRTTAEETRRILRTERSELEAALAEKAQTAIRLKGDGALIDEITRDFADLRRQSITSVGLGEKLVTFDGRIAGLGANIEEARRHRDPKLLEEQERLRTQRQTAGTDKFEADKTLRDADAAKNRVAGRYETLIQDNHDRLRSERRDRSRSIRNSGSAADISGFRERARSMVLEAIPEAVGGLAADCQRRVTDRRPSLYREMTTALMKHHQQFQVTLPFSDTDATADVVGAWAACEKHRLDTHELVQYEDQCLTAAAEMTAAFRDDLLHRLHDEFEGIKETLAELNRHLKDRQFHGRDYYVFRSSESGTHADLIDLVRESRRPDFQLPLFGSSQAKDETETPVSRAVRRIEEILLNQDAKTDEIEDPRKYFNFELYIYDDQGRIRSSLTSRAGTGSGGEGQLPFYIAIGASLAATYQNRRTGESGLSLAIFDEAFNRLDTKAIGACADFMKDLGLQVVLATPDEKRHVFMEVVDTIVNVNRIGNEVMIDTEHLTEKARNALAAADPYRKGFDTFKAELVAAEEAVLPKDQAAE